MFATRPHIFIFCPVLKSCQCFTARSFEKSTSERSQRSKHNTFAICTSVAQDNMHAADRNSCFRVDLYALELQNVSVCLFWKCAFLAVLLLELHVAFLEVFPSLCVSSDVLGHGASVCVGSSCRRKQKYSKLLFQCTTFRENVP